MFRMSYRVKPLPGRRGAGQRAPRTQNHENRGPIKAKQEANELRNKTKIPKTRGIHGRNYWSRTESSYGSAEVYVIKHWSFYWNVKTVSVLFNQRQGITIRYLHVWMPAECMWVVSTVGKRELLLSGCFGVEVQAILLFWPEFAVTVGLLKLLFLRKYEQIMNRDKKVYQNNIYQNILKNTCKTTPWKWRK